MIIAAFTYRLLERELFRKLVGQEWANVEEMIQKVNRFLRQEAKSAKKARMEGKTMVGRAKKEEQILTYPSNPKGLSTTTGEGHTKERGEGGKAVISHINRKVMKFILHEAKKSLPPDIQRPLKPATAVVVGFSGESIWSRGKILLPFTLEDYRGVVIVQNTTPGPPEHSHAVLRSKLSPWMKKEFL
uniref:Uncharacterized protein n=1 Tax=Lactuca sativa TaxID=4236 RepID=A0A9R1XEP3_LACSA|nr:hypothetical protein LSAT_V11C400203710 [Lactuca sativa]